MQLCFANFKVALLTKYRPEIDRRTAASFSVWSVPLQKSPVEELLLVFPFDLSLYRRAQLVTLVYQKNNTHTVLLGYNMASLKSSMKKCMMFCARKCDREAVHGYLGIFLIKSCTIQPEWCIEQSQSFWFWPPLPVDRTCFEKALNCALPIFVFTQGLWKEKSTPPPPPKYFLIF